MRSLNESIRGGDIEIWVVGRDERMICFIAQGKRLYAHPSEEIKDRYDELNFIQMKALLTEAENENNIPLYFFYNTPYNGGYFVSKGINKPEDYGWNYSFAHDVYENYYSWNGNNDDYIAAYKHCSEINNKTRPMHSLVDEMIKQPVVLIQKYLSLRGNHKLGTFYRTGMLETDYHKKFPHEFKKYLTTEQIGTHTPYMAYIPGWQPLQLVVSKMKYLCI